MCEAVKTGREERVRKIFKKYKFIPTMACKGIFTSITITVCYSGNTQSAVFLVMCPIAIIHASEYNTRTDMTADKENGRYEIGL